MATTKRRSRKKTAGAKKRTVVVIGKHKTRRRKSHSVGATKHHKRRRKSGGIGSTGGSLKQIAWMAVGIATGVGVTEVVLRPVENYLERKWPAVGKLIAAGEIFLGGYMAIKSKSAFMKSVGVGVLAGGVNKAMAQFRVLDRIPKIAGYDDYTEMRVPVNGDFTNMLAGILDDSRRFVRTSVVSGIGDLDATKVVAGSGDYMAGDWDDALESSMFVKG